MLSDTGSQHEFNVGNQLAEILIVPKGNAGFTYQLRIDGNAIEQSIDGPQASSPLDVGSRVVQLARSREGLGMTLRNNPLSDNGAVVWSVEEGKAADAAGILVGDVVLSIEDRILYNIDKLVEYVSSGSNKALVNMELAGAAASRVVTLVKSKDQKIGLVLQSTSCGIGILVTEIESDGCASQSHLKIGDVILSIDDMVPVSPKHAVNLIVEAQYIVKFVVSGNATS